MRPGVWGSWREATGLLPALLLGLAMWAGLIVLIRWIFRALG